FLVSSPLPRILTPSLGFLMIPVSINEATVTVAPSSNLFNTSTLIATISFEFRLVKPLLGILLYNGICPPSNPILGAPERAFCPLWPLPAVFALPEPCPRPFLKRSCLEPSAGLNSDRFIYVHLLLSAIIFPQP